MNRRHHSLVIPAITALTVILSIVALSCNAATSNRAEETTEPATAVAKETKDAVVTFDGTTDLYGIKPEKPVVIDFNATWCGPCRMFSPIFHKVAAEKQGKAEFYSVDVDKYPEISIKYGVRSIPYVVIINTDGSVKTIAGYMDESQFKEFLSTAFVQ